MTKHGRGGLVEVRARDGLLERCDDRSSERECGSPFLSEGFGGYSGTEGELHRGVRHRRDVIVTDGADLGTKDPGTTAPLAGSRRLKDPRPKDVVEAEVVLQALRVIQNSPGVGTRELVDGLVLAQRDDVLLPLARALSRFADQPRSDRVASNQKFAYEAIGHLVACTL